MYDHGGLNRFYRLIWSDASQCFIPIPEVSKSRGKRKGTGVVAAIALLSIIGSVSHAALAGSTSTVGMQGPQVVVGTQNALPTGGQVVGGSASIQQQGNTQTINQTTRSAAINWQTFNIGSENTVTFVQPDASSIALNRVIGNQASQIYGVLKSNGQIFLVNPNGVLFAKGSQVSAAGILASTRDMSVDDFLAGKYKLVGSGAGAVVNNGSIDVSSGGYVALVGAQVINNGIVSANEGDVRLAAANEVTLRIDNGGLLEFTSTQGALDALAENGGLIRADGGRIFLTAEALDHLTTATVNNTGVIEAHTVANKNGKIVLLGDMDVGTTMVAGTLDASAPEGGDGGFIETSAAHVHIAHTAKVTTQGAVTGQWLIDPVDYTVAASGGDMTGATLSAALGSTNVTIQSTSGAAGTEGDVIIDDSVTWSSNTLTLNALGDIRFNQSIAASGTGALTLEYGQATTDGLGATYTLANGVSIDLPAGQNFSTKKGSAGAVESYTVITALGLAGDQNGTTLQGMKGDLTGRYVLGDDINAIATLTWNPVGPDNLGFDPVASGLIDPNTQLMQVFTGKFDGLGHAISDLNISRSPREHVGLFGVVAGATIQNVTLTNASVKGYIHVGALVGTSGVDSNLQGSSFSNIHVSGSIEAQADGGGLIGWIDTATVTNATSSATVGPDSEALIANNMGGIIGSGFETALSNVSATGNVTGQSNIGGVIGRLNGGSIVDGTATGDISASDTLGGGLVGSGRGNFTNLSATGDITGGANLGGLFGSMDGNLENGDAIGSVSGNGGIGGLIGYGYGSVNNSTASGEVTGSDFVGGLIGRSFASTTNSQSTSNVTGNERVGGLVGDNYGSVSDSTASGTVDGNNWVGGLIGYNDAALTTVEASGAVTGGSFVGGLVGENKLGHVNQARATGTVTATGDIVGGLIGKNKLGFIENSSYSGLVAGGNHVGSLIGFNGGTVATSNSDSDVSGTYNVGGLIGENDGAVSDSFATGDVNGQENVGGLVGSGYGNGSISSSYANGVVTATANNAGGLIGRSQGTISNSDATGVVSGVTNVGGLAGHSSGDVTDSTAIGQTTGTGDAVGGLIGENYGTVTGSSATGDVVGVDYVGGLVGDSYGSIDSSQASGDVNGNDSVGGFVGYLNPGASITLSSASGNVDGGSNIGGFAGVADVETTISGSSATGTASGGTNVGGFAGDNTGTITDSEAHGAVDGTEESTGGFAGINYGVINTSESTGNTTGVDFVGGFVGLNSGAITASTANGETTGVGYVGGFVGSAEDPSLIEGSTANGDVHGEERVGGFAGVNLSTITTSFAYGDVDGFYRVGGFAGRNSGSGVITTSIAHGAVVGTDSQIGGFAGRNDGELNQVDARGAVDGTGVEDVGGLVGSHRGAIVNSVASGTVVGANNVGGLVGNVLYDTDDDSNPIPALILGSSASGAVTGGGAVGGLIGNNDLGLVTDSSTTSVVMASGDGVGGLIGVNNGDITNATASGDVTGATKVGGLIGDALDGTTVLLSTASGTTIGSGYVGGFIGVLSLNSTVITSHAMGNVTGNGNQVGGFVGDSAGTISASDATGSVGGVNEIGGFVGRNSGSLNTVSATGNVTSFGQGQYAAGGLIGVNSGTVTLATAGNTVSGDTLVGGLIGDNSGTVDNSSATGSVSGSTSVGGFVGVNSGTISVANATGAAQGTTEVGGFFGNNAGSIMDAHAHGNVSGETHVGGFGGINSGTGTLTKVYETGNVTLSGSATIAEAGGLIGRNEGAVNIAYAIGSVTGTGVSEQIGGLIGYHSGSVTDAYATGATSGADVVGGLIGQTDSSMASATNVYAKGAVTSVGTARGALIGRSTAGSVVNGYWDMFSTNLVTAVGDNQGGTLTGAGFTTTDAKQQANYAGFDFGSSGEWKNYNGDTTPLLTAWLTALTIDVSDTAVSYVYNGLGHQDAVSNLTYSDLNAPSSGHLFGAAHYDTAKNAGVYTDLTGLYSDQQGYNITLVNHGSLTITPKQISVNAVATNKTYDGTTNVSTALTSTDLIAGDVVSFTGIGNAIDKNAGLGKTVNVTSISGDGADLGNYSFADTTQTTVDITKKALEISALGANRAYNGTTLVDVVIDAVGVIAGDQLALAGTGNMADKNAGVGKSVSVSGISGSGLDAGNYDFATTTQAIVDISKRMAAVSAVGINRAYDGTTSVGITLTSDDILEGDDLQLGGSGTMLDKHAGLGKAVTINDFSSEGVDLANYEVIAPTQTTVDISKRLAVISALGIDRTYDGNTAVATTVALENLVLGDELQIIGTGTMQNKNAGQGKALTVGITGTGTDLSNYEIATTTQTTVNIAKRVASVTAVGQDKTYDGSTGIGVSLTPTDVLDGDELMLTGAGTLVDPNAGVGKAASVVGISGTGADAGNYDFSAPLTTTATVAKKGIGISLEAPVVKREDGTVSVPLRSSNFVINGLVEGDQLQVGDVTGQFSDSVPGVGKPVSVTLSEADLVSGDGTLASNYDLLSTTITGDFGVILSSSSPSYDAAIASVPTNIINNLGATSFSVVMGPQGPAVSTGEADNGVSTQSTSTVDGGIASVQTRENLLFRRTFSIADGGIKLPSGVTEDDSTQ